MNICISEYLLRSNETKTHKLIEHRKAGKQETSEINIFTFTTPSDLKEQNWLMRIAILEAFNCIFKITEKNKKIITLSSGKMRILTHLAISKT